MSVFFFKLVKSELGIVNTVSSAYKVVLQLVQCGNRSKANTSNTG